MPAILQGVACWHVPEGVVAGGAAPACLIRRACSSTDPPTVAACVAALNNVCIFADGCERVCEEAKRARPNVSACRPLYM